MIAIFSNTGEWGGVDVLIARFAEYLRAHNVPFCIIEPRGSRLRQELEWAKFVDHNEISLISNAVTHVFVPTVSKLRDQQFPWESFGKAKIFAWIVHPNDVFRAFFPFSVLSMNILGYRVVTLLRAIFGSHTLSFDSLFLELAKQNALAVMDGATSRSLRYFVPSQFTVIPIVPIPSPIYSSFTPRPWVGDELSIGYLGRMDSMKWSAMRPFIQHVIAPLARHKKIALHVVSEGSHLLRLKRLCQKSDIQFHEYGYLPNELARETIITRTDLAVAMGTSALDLAGSGHPCVVLDPSLGMFSRPQRRFRYIHESGDYTLGEYRDFPAYVAGRRTFEEISDMYELLVAGDRGRDYVRRAHDPDKCFEALLICIRKSNLTTSELMSKVGPLIDSFERVKSKPLSSMVGVQCSGGSKRV